MLIITAFYTFFVCLFASSWDGESLCVCVLGGGVKNNYPKLFNVLLFFFFSCFYYTILSSDLRPPLGPTASWRLKVFCTLWWMLIGVFIIQSWMSFLVCSFLSLIPFSFRHHHIFLWSQQTFRFGLFQKGPKCCTLHMKVLSHRCEVLLEREWMTEKRYRHTLGTIQNHSIKQKGLFQIFLSFFAATIILNECHSIFPAVGTIGSTLQKNLIIVRLTVWLWKAHLCRTKL